jgi:hypothetical protein
MLADKTNIGQERVILQETYVKCKIKERSGDIITCATRMLQFWSEMQQT